MLAEADHAGGAGHAPGGVQARAPRARVVVEPVGVDVVPVDLLLLLLK